MLPLSPFTNWQPGRGVAVRCPSSCEVSQETTGHCNEFVRIPTHMHFRYNILNLVMAEIANWPATNQ